MTNTSKRTTKANREVECKASQYRLHAAALEVLRETPGFLTYPEAVVLAKAGKRPGGCADPRLSNRRRNQLTDLSLETSESLGEI